VDNIKMALTKVGCNNGIWRELPLDRIRWWILVLLALNLRVLLQECYFSVKLFFWTLSTF
jgi:hypothetical protein